MKKIWYKGAILISIGILALFNSTYAYTNFIVPQIDESGSRIIDAITDSTSSLCAKFIPEETIPASSVQFYSKYRGDNGTWTSYDHFGQMKPLSLWKIGDDTTIGATTYNTELLFEHTTSTLASLVGTSTTEHWVDVPFNSTIWLYTGNIYAICINPPTNSLNPAVYGKSVTTTAILKGTDGINITGYNPDMTESPNPNGYAPIFKFVSAFESTLTIIVPSGNPVYTGFTARGNCNSSDGAIDLTINRRYLSATTTTEFLEYENEDPWFTSGVACTNNEWSISIPQSPYGLNHFCVAQTTQICRDYFADVSSNWQDAYATTTSSTIQQFLDEYDLDQIDRENECTSTLCQAWLRFRQLRPFSYVIDIKDIVAIAVEDASSDANDFDMSVTIATSTSSHFNGTFSLFNNNTLKTFLSVEQWSVLRGISAMFIYFSGALYVYKRAKKFI